MKPSPVASNRCAVVLFTHKNVFDEAERICIASCFSKLNQWDRWVVCPPGLDFRWLVEKYGVRIANFEAINFASHAAYNKWLLQSHVYQAFSNYEYMLVSQPDVLVLRDEVSYWLGVGIDYIGAPWHYSITHRPNFKRRPDLVGVEYKLNVGNGGFSLRRNSALIHLLQKYQEEIEIFNGNEDAMISTLAGMDDGFRLADYRQACRFSLELLPSQVLAVTGQLPMGFHNLKNHDSDLWGYLIKGFGIMAD
jgi:hypothetical protein